MKNSWIIQGWSIWGLGCRGPMNYSWITMNNSWLMNFRKAGHTYSLAWGCNVDTELWVTQSWRPHQLPEPALWHRKTSVLLLLLLVGFPEKNEICHWHCHPLVLTQQFSYFLMHLCMSPQPACTRISFTFGGFCWKVYNKHDKIFELAQYFLHFKKSFQ